MSETTSNPTPQVPKSLTSICDENDPAQIKKNHASGKKVKNDSINPSIENIRQDVNNYLEFYKLKSNQEIAIGTIFNIDLIRDFLYQIDEYNKNANKAENIDSFRIYKTRTEDLEYGWIDGVVLVPTMENDNDFFKVFNPILPQNPNLFVLGYGTPCPNLCIKSFYSQKG